MPTVAIDNLATVDISDTTTVDAVDMSTVATVDSGHVATVAMSRQPTAELWITDKGDLVPAKKVRRIRLAQDALSVAEEAVYDVLWAAKPPPREETVRTVQAGYDFLVRKTRFARRTIQRIVAKLLEKEFIEIHAPADIYSRAATTYRVYGYRAVLDKLALRGRLHVAKMGPGVVFVQRYDNRQRADLSTVAIKPPSTVAISPGSTVAAMAIVTGVNQHMTTVAGEATQILRQEEPLQPSSSEFEELRHGLAQQLGPVDDDAVRQLLSQCRLRAGDCTAAEILYFVQHKVRLVKNIQNPVGLLLVAVPRHFENNGHAAVRALLGDEQERRRLDWEETRRFWERIAEDPNEPEDARRQARQFLASMSASA